MVEPVEFHTIRIIVGILPFYIFLRGNSQLVVIRNISFVDHSVVIENYRYFHDFDRFWKLVDFVPLVVPVEKAAHGEFSEGGREVGETFGEIYSQFEVLQGRWEREDVLVEIEAKFKVCNFRRELGYFLVKFISKSEVCDVGREFTDGFVKTIPKSEMCNCVGEVVYCFTESMPKFEVGDSWGKMVH